MLDKFAKTAKQIFKKGDSPMEEKKDTRGYGGYAYGITTAKKEVEQENTDSKAAEDKAITTEYDDTATEEPLTTDETEDTYEDEQEETTEDETPVGESQEQTQAETDETSSEEPASDSLKKIISMKQSLPKREELKQEPVTPDRDSENLSEKEKLLARLEEIKREEERKEKENEEKQELIILANKLELPLMATMILTIYETVEAIQKDSEKKAKEIEELKGKFDDQSQKQPQNNENNKKLISQFEENPAKKYIDQMQHAQELIATIIDESNNGDSVTAMSRIKKAANELNELITLLLRGLKS